ncbi:MAG: hypothetical protein WAW23_11285 [Candidatus Methanoperedens sp.]
MGEGRGIPLKAASMRSARKWNGFFPWSWAGSGHGKNPLGETLPGVGLVPEAELPPLDGGPDCPFGSIVRGLSSLMREESEKMIPVVKQSLGSSAHLSIRAGQVLLAVVAGTAKEVSMAVRKNSRARDSPMHGAVLNNKR